MFLLIEMQALNPLDPRGAVGKTGGLLFQDVLLILGVVTVLTSLLLVWAARYARRRKRHRHLHHGQPQILKPATAESDREAEEESGHHRHRRRRVPRRDHRGRNPTLAETGGLPPVRSGPPESPIA